MAILECASALQLHSDRRHRACAISQRQHRERKERQSALKRATAADSSVTSGGHITMHGSKVSTQSIQPSSNVIATTTAMTANSKQDKRALLKAELEEDLVEALELLEDESGSEEGGNSINSSTPSCYHHHAPLSLLDVAVRKQERKRAFADYEFVTIPKVEVLGDLDTRGRCEGENENENESGWEILQDDGDDDVSPSKTYAQVISISV